MKILTQIVLATALILTLTSNVNAETAWIKWKHYTIVTAQSVKKTDEWYQQEAFPNYGACMIAIRKTAKSVCNMGSWENCEAFDTSASATSIGEMDRHYYAFSCYPDTIDPRKNSNQ